MGDCERYEASIEEIRSDLKKVFSGLCDFKVSTASDGLLKYIHHQTGNQINDILAIMDKMISIMESHRHIALRDGTGTTTPAIAGSENGVSDE